jgi:hypothetical protein
VGNFDTGTDMKSVQIADLRIIGTPIVPVSTDPTIPTTQTTETIPCNRDCLYGDWGNCSYDTTNNKWVQTRPKTDPVGSGTACNPSELTRNCPNTEAWSDWGAFVNSSGTASQKGTTEQFKSGQIYTESSIVKQVRYAKPTGTKGCPDNVNTDSNGMCYETREVYGQYGDCQIVDGKWQKGRSNAITGKTDYINCEPSEITKMQKWQEFGTNSFLVQHVESGGYMEVGAKGWSKARKNTDSPVAGITGRGDNAYQLFRKGANKNCGYYCWGDMIFSNDGRWALDPTGGVNVYFSHKNFQLDELWESGQHHFQYDPITSMIKSVAFGKCFESSGMGDYVNLRTCDPNNKNQRFKVVPQ